jgi:predicted alpha/beta hydrolase
VIESIRFPAPHDAFSLGGELFLPDGAPRACALIGSAMAVRARFYAPFARHLAEQGIAALTFDYRGIGASRPNGSLKGFTAHFHDWGEKDLAGAADLLGRRFPGLPLHFVGHSAGGQLMGLAEAPIASALFVAAGTAYWRAYSGFSRAFLGALWYALIPAVTAAVGYLPMRAVGQGDDVPQGVAREWAAWGKDPRYVFSYAEPRGGMAYTRYAGPLRGLSFADDDYAPRPAMESLLSLYTQAKKELIDGGNGAPVGHFGFFKTPALWPEQVRFLTEPSQSGMR